MCINIVFMIEIIIWCICKLYFLLWCTHTKDSMMKIKKNDRYQNIAWLIMGVDTSINPTSLRWWDVYRHKWVGIAANLNLCKLGIVSCFGGFGKLAICCSLRVLFLYTSGLFLLQFVLSHFTSLAKLTGFLTIKRILLQRASPVDFMQCNACYRCSWNYLQLLRGNCTHTKMKHLDI